MTRRTNQWFFTVLLLLQLQETNDDECAWASISVGSSRPVHECVSSQKWSIYCFSVWWGKGRKWFVVVIVIVIIVERGKRRGEKEGCTKVGCTVVLLCGGRKVMGGIDGWVSNETWHVRERAEFLIISSSGSTKWGVPNVEPAWAWNVGYWCMRTCVRACSLKNCRCACRVGWVR